jgi:hypothetical protein
MGMASSSPSSSSLQQRLIWFVGISGFVAFALVGFLGYDGDPTFLHNLFFHMTKGAFYIPIWGFTFLWFSVLVVLLLLYMVRDSTYRRTYRLAIIVLSAISVFAATVLYYFHEHIPPPGGGGLKDLPWYGIVNFGVIGIYLAANEWHWFLRDDPVLKADPDQSREEVAIGEIIAGGIMLLLLSLFFTTGPINLLSGAGLGPSLPACTQSAFGLPWPCLQSFASLNSPHSLSLIDTIVAMICFVLGPLGLVILIFIRSLTTNADAGLEDIRETIKHMLHFPHFAVWQKLGNRLRFFFLPFLNFAAILLAGVAARSNSSFLHNVSNHAGCYTLLTHFFCDGQIGGKEVLLNYTNELVAFGSGVAALLCTLGAGALFVYDRQSLKVTLLFLRDNVLFTGSFVFCLLSLSLSAFNVIDQIILVFMGEKEYPWPFPQPSAVAAVSLVLLLVLLLSPSRRATQDTPGDRNPVSET